MGIGRFLFRCCNTCFSALILFCSISQIKAADVPLTWDPSTSPNISGYRIYIGNASGTYNASITLGDQTAYTVTDLEAGSWYFAVTAFDVNGSESDYSNEVSKTIDSTGNACDSNGDASVDSLDIKELVDVILELSPPSGSHDLNSDGSVDALDLQILNNVVLGLRSCP